VPEAKLPKEVTSRIGPFYVYVLVDPRDDHIFYVGKGTGSRLESHGREAGLEHSPLLDGPKPKQKLAIIREIRRTGMQPRIEVVRHGIATADEAFAIEAALIACLPDLANEVGGWQSDETRIGLDELLVRFGAVPLRAQHPPVLFIRLADHVIPLDDGEEMEPGYFRYRAGWDPLMDVATVYDATRGWWRVSPRSFEQHGAQHVVVVAQGVTRAVYTVERWFGPRADGRYALAGTAVISGPLFDSYVGRLGQRVPFACTPRTQSITGQAAREPQPQALGLSDDDICVGILMQSPAESE
jgi:hypothetical protein